MHFLRLRAIFVLSMAGLLGCAKAQSDSGQAQNMPTTQPAAVATAAAPETPAGSMLKIGQAQQWFPPARLHLETSKGVVVARLYSDDPKDTLTGKEVVNSYDMRMELPSISDPSQITQTVWINHSESMDRQDSPYGIFLNTQGEVLQPMDVTAYFQQVDASTIRVTLKGTFVEFKAGDQMPHPVPPTVIVAGFLDATVN
jgi:hypothetical protein